MTTTTMNSSAKHTDTHSHREHLGEAAGHVREDLGELSKDAKEAIGAVGSCAKDGLDSALELAKTGGDKCKAVHTSLEDRVRKHPTAAVLLTIGAGILVGRMLPRG